MIIEGHHSDRALPAVGSGAETDPDADDSSSDDDGEEPTRYNLDDDDAKGGDFNDPEWLLDQFNRGEIHLDNSNVLSSTANSSESMESLGGADAQRLSVGGSNSDGTSGHGGAAVEESGIHDAMDFTAVGRGGGGNTADAAAALSLQTYDIFRSGSSPLPFHGSSTASAHALSAPTRPLDDNLGSGGDVCSGLSDGATRMDTGNELGVQQSTPQTQQEGVAAGDAMMLDGTKPSVPSPQNIMLAQGDCLSAEAVNVLASILCTLIRQPDRDVTTDEPQEKQQLLSLTSVKDLNLNVNQLRLVTSIFTFLRPWVTHYVINDKGQSELPPSTPFNSTPIITLTNAVFSLLPSYDKKWRTRLSPMSRSGQKVAVTIDDDIVKFIVDDGRFDHGVRTRLQRAIEAQRNTTEGQMREYYHPANYLLALFGAQYTAHLANDSTVPRFRLLDGQTSHKRFSWSVIYSSPSCIQRRRFWFLAAKRRSSNDYNDDDDDDDDDGKDKSKAKAKAATASKRSKKSRPKSSSTDQKTRLSSPEYWLRERRAFSDAEWEQLTQRVHNVQHVLEYTKDNLKPLRKTRTTLRTRLSRLIPGKDTDTDARRSANRERLDSILIAITQLEEMQKLANGTLRRFKKMKTAEEMATLSKSSSSTSTSTSTSTSGSVPFADRPVKLQQTRAQGEPTYKPEDVNASELWQLALTGKLKLSAVGIDPGIHYALAVSFMTAEEISQTLTTYKGSRANRNHDSLPDVEGIANAFCTNIISTTNIFSTLMDPEASAILRELDENGSTNGIEADDDPVDNMTHDDLIELARQKRARRKLKKPRVKKKGVRIRGAHVSASSGNKAYNRRLSKRQRDNKADIENADNAIAACAYDTPEHILASRSVRNNNSGTYESVYRDATLQQL
ncbi:MAG: hypothetical protein WCD70_02740, partial [Alphaproteobacteria bacterium]